MLLDIFHQFFERCSKLYMLTFQLVDVWYCSQRQERFRDAAGKRQKHCLERGVVNVQLKWAIWFRARSGCSLFSYFALVPELKELTRYRYFSHYFDWILFLNRSLRGFRPLDPCSEFVLWPLRLRDPWRFECSDSKVWPTILTDGQSVDPPFYMFWYRQPQIDGYIISYRDIVDAMAEQWALCGFLAVQNSSIGDLVPCLVGPLVGHH